VLGVELKVKDIDRTREISKKLETALNGPPYEVQDWYQTNENLFRMLELQKLTLVVLLTLIIIVAAVNMVSSLTLIVTDKTREIAILKAMGARSPTVARVFQCLGLYVGCIGTAIGIALGVVTCCVASVHGYRLEAGVYMIDRLPVAVDSLEVVLVAATTLAISLVATWVPARNAASLRPIDGLRYD
jgi:lipoprotein-releasing system permease protein